MKKPVLGIALVVVSVAAWRYWGPNLPLWRVYERPLGNSETLVTYERRTKSDYQRMVFLDLGGMDPTDSVLLEAINSTVAAVSEARWRKYLFPPIEGTFRTVRIEPSLDIGEKLSSLRCGRPQGFVAEKISTVPAVAEGSRALLRAEKGVTRRCVEIHVLAGKVVYVELINRFYADRVFMRR